MSKKLQMFLMFQSDEYFKDKSLLALSHDVLKDSEGKQIGYTITTVVYKDETDYGDDAISNAGDSYKVKILNSNFKVPKFPCYIKLVEPSCKVWGEFSNNLSVTAKDIHVLEQSKG